MTTAIEANIITFDPKAPATNPAIALANNISPYSALPDELLVCIFSFLEIPHLLVVGQVDRRCYNISSRDDVWKSALPKYVIESIAKSTKGQEQTTTQSAPALESIAVKLQELVKTLISQIWPFMAHVRTILQQQPVQNSTEATTTNSQLVILGKPGPYKRCFLERTFANDYSYLVAAVNDALPNQKVVVRVEDICEPKRFYEIRFNYSTAYAENSAVKKILVKSLLNKTVHAKEFGFGTISPAKFPGDYRINFSATNLFYEGPYRAVAVPIFENLRTIRLMHEICETYQKYHPDIDPPLNEERVTAENLHLIAADIKDIFEDWRDTPYTFESFVAALPEQRLRAIFAKVT